jgi:hypothetical protein
MTDIFKNVVSCSRKIVNEQCDFSDTSLGCSKYSFSFHVAKSLKLLDEIRTWACAKLCLSSVSRVSYYSIAFLAAFELVSTYCSKNSLEIKTDQRWYFSTGMYHLDYSSPASSEPAGVMVGSVPQPSTLEKWHKGVPPLLPLPCSPPRHRHQRSLLPWPRRHHHPRTNNNVYTNHNIVNNNSNQQQQQQRGSQPLTFLLVWPQNNQSSCSSTHHRHHRSSRLHWPNSNQTLLIGVPTT